MSSQEDLLPEIKLAAFIFFLSAFAYLAYFAVYFPFSHSFIQNPLGLGKKSEFIFTFFTDFS